MVNMRIHFERIGVSVVSVFQPVHFIPTHCKQTAGWSAWKVSRLSQILVVPLMGEEI